MTLGIRDQKRANFRRDACTYSKHFRLAALYGTDTHTQNVSPIEEATLRELSPPSFASGEGGLHSTAHDYLGAARMLLGRGRCEGVRVLSHRAVALMTTNQLPLEERKSSRWAGRGFGLGVEIVEDLAQQNAYSDLGEYASVGSYGWPGALGTYWLVDPKEDMIQIFMIQQRPTDRSLSIAKVFHRLAYHAIDD